MVGWLVGFFFEIFWFFLQVRFAVEGCGEGHVVQGTFAGAGVVAAVRLHPGDAVLGLVRRQFAAQLVRHDVRLVTGQNAERINHLVTMKRLIEFILGGYCR